MHDEDLRVKIWERGVVHETRLEKHMKPSRKVAVTKVSRHYRAPSISIMT